MLAAIKGIGISFEQLAYAVIDVQRVELLKQQIKGSTSRLSENSIDILAKFVGVIF